MTPIFFYYDVVCPYAYIASRRIEAIARSIPAPVAWRPVLLGGVFRAQGAPQAPAAEWSPARARLGEQDLAHQASFHGVPLRRPPEHPRRTVEAMRLLVAAPDDARPALTAALYQAYWVEGRDVADRGVLAEIAREHGVDPAAAGSQAAKDGLYANTAEAVERGAFGVPSFYAQGRLWWGQDRLPLLRAALAGEGREPPPAPAVSGRELTFYHDFSSPFSYLAATQVERVAARAGARLRWKPILLGGLFRAIGTPDVPLFAMSPAKQSYYLQDLHDWAAWWGEPFRFPGCFPVRTVLPLRAALAEPRATLPLYRALWADGRDIGEPDVVAAVLAEAGLDAAAILDAAQSPGVKQALHDNTSEAQAAGACGVPTFHVAGEPLLWGQDRLPLVEALLAGRWEPAGRPSAQATPTPA